MSALKNVTLTYNYYIVSCCIGATNNTNLHYRSRLTQCCPLNNPPGKQLEAYQTDSPGFSFLLT